MDDNAQLSYGLHMQSDCIKVLFKTRAFWFSSFEHIVVLNSFVPAQFCLYLVSLLTRGWPYIRSFESWIRW